MKIEHVIIKKDHLRICENGHEYHKSSDCPVCPICEKGRKTMTNPFLSKISAPARRALEREEILTLEKLSTYSEKEILGLHGLGPGSIPKLEKELKTKGLEFKK